MSSTLDLVFRQDGNPADDSVLHLKPCTTEDGFNLAQDGYIPGALDESADRVPEALSLIVGGTSADDLAANIQKLALKVRQANQWKDSPEYMGVWLRNKINGESNARQAFITKARHRAISAIMSQHVYRQYLIQQYGLELERMPFWEAAAYVNHVNTAVNALGGTANYTTGGSNAPVTGDQPARIASCGVYEIAADVIEKFWLGFRSDRWGNPQYFVPVWNLHKHALGQTYFGDDTSDVDGGGYAYYDTSAQDNYKIVCDFSTHAEMKRRVTVTCDEMTYYSGAHHYAYHRGTYNVLLRARITPAGTGVMQVQLADGSYASDDTQMRIQDRVTISQTGWGLYELGTVQIPSMKTQQALDMCTMAILAERVSGTAYLEMDCLIFIPIDEGFVSCDGFQIGSGTAVGVYCLPDGSKYGSYYAVGYGYQILAPRAGGGLPVGLTSTSHGYLVLAAQRPGHLSVKGDTLDIYLQTYPRYDQLRGAA